jgi:CHAT domain-containing protein/tetratricopeptide (TPR) repeat protein
MKRIFDSISAALRRVQPALLSASVMALLFANPLAPSAIQPVQAAQNENLVSLATECIHRGEYEKAVRLGEQIIAAAREAGDRSKEAAGFEVIGNAYFYLDKNPEAIEAFQTHLRLARELGDRSAEASALKDLAITYKRFSRFDEAFEMMTQSLQIYRQQNDSYGVASTLENLGMGYSGLGAYNQAFDMYSEALAIARSKQDAKLIFGGLMRMGQLYITMNIPSRAIDCLKEAVAISQQQEFSPIDRIWGMQIMNMALVSDGRVDEAIALLKKALLMCRQIGWKTGEADTLQGLAYNTLDKGEPAVALNYLKQSLALLEEVNFQQFWDIYSGLGMAYQRLGDLQQAINYYRKAVAQLESFRFQLSSEQQRATFLSKHQRIYRELMQALIERHQQQGNGTDDRQAFAVYEQGKARATTEAIAEARLDSEEELEPELRSRRDTLNARIAELHTNLVNAGSKAQQRRQIIENLAQTERDFDQLIIEIKRRSPHYAQMHYPTPLQLPQAQALLDRATAMIAYAITRDKLFAFVLTESSFQVIRLNVSPDVLAARVQNYVDLINQGDERSWQNVSARLYTELIAPLRETLSPAINRLLIVPDGALCYLPFETLQNANQPGSPFLLADFAISYVPSATVLAQLQNSDDAEPAPSRENLLIFAHPTLAASLQNQDGEPRDYARLLYDEEGLEISPLPFSADEAGKVEFYGGGRSRVFTERQASEHWIKTHRLDSFRVIHFATHGLVSQRHPLRSALVLASAEGDGEDGFLQAREILQLKLKSDLVVLSACQTARGQILAGEGAQGLAQAFLNAGAQSVVASLWNVNDQRAALFMEAFYRHLAKGQNKVEALRSAKLEMFKIPATSSPRYWAPFILIGEAEKSITLTPPSLWVQYGKWLVAPVIALTAVFAFRLFRKRGFK